AATAALASVPTPSVLLASGTRSHRHAYWSLTDSLDPDALHDGNTRLAIALGADAGAVCSPATILRPAGTLNHKRSPARRVELLAYERRVRYEPTELVGALPAAQAPARSYVATSPRSDDPLASVAPAVYFKALTGLTVPRSGKVPCPLHDDGTPSCHVYPTAARGWYCYGCDRGGDAYTLAAALWGLDPRTDFLTLRERLRVLCLGEAAA
ncbi:MAG: CHC2 zinc finger domain-containing protein, partial [Solirubrobacteraceae bacterium]